MGFSEPVLFLDLHGVLVQTQVVFDRYKELTVDHLINNFSLSEEDAMSRYDQAFQLWETTAFDYLKNPFKKKMGKEFLSFLEYCDKLFPQYLYQDLDTEECQDLRTRPFEYKIAAKVPSLYPEVAQTLKNLSSNGYPMYIASSSHSSHVRGMIESNNLDQYIEGYFGFDTLAATKHTLKYYRNMLKRASADAGSSFMIGNSIHEVLKPRKLGMKTIHINRERKVPHDVKKLADKSINDLQSLPILLDSIQISL